MDTASTSHDALKLASVTVGCILGPNQEKRGGDKVLSFLVVPLCFFSFELKVWTKLSSMQTLVLCHSVFCTSLLGKEWESNLSRRDHMFSLCAMLRRSGCSKRVDCWRRML